MFNNDLYLTHQLDLQNEPATGLPQYHRMRRLGEIGKFWAWLTGRTRALREPPQIAEGGRHFAGLREVPIDRIKGSEGRCHDFDRDFNPLHEDSRDRWLSVFRARLRGVSLPAVELTEVEDTYFVRDGHHRISVARALGQEYIEAVVTRAGGRKSGLAGRG
jgi:hypothetical protein